MRRSLLELIIAVVGSSLIGLGLSQGVGGLGWQTAIGLGLLLVAVAYFALAPMEIIKGSRVTKYVLVLGGVLLILLPGFQT